MPIFARLGQTPLHTLFIENKKYTKNLELLVQVLLKGGVKLWKRDRSSRLAWSYLCIEPERWIEVVRQVDYFEWHSTPSDAFLDATGTSLVHQCAKVGAVQCLTYLLAHLPKQFIAELQNPSPLAVAVAHDHKDCASILIKIYPNIFECYETKVDGVKINLFKQMIKNYWNDMLFEIVENAKHQNKFFNLIVIMIKSQCLEYANNLINIYKAHSNFHDIHLRAFLHRYSKIFDNEIENAIPVHTEFLKHFDQDNFSDPMIELFSNGLRNWNFVLCREMIRQLGLSYIARGFREARLNPISLTFHQLSYCNNMKFEIKELILTLSQEFSFNFLASFPVGENSVNLPRYSATYNEDDLSTVQYSPLILAVMLRSYSVVQWLLKIEKNEHFAVDLNFSDTLRRTPIMHAVLNNDLKMIKLLFNPDYMPDSDLDCWSHSTLANNPNRPIHLVSRDSSMLTLFHYLISPMKYFNYFKSDVIFSMLWSCLDINDKTESFVSDLYKYALSKNAANLTSLIAKNQCAPNRENEEFVPKMNHSIENKISSTFHSDYEKLFKQCSRSDKNFNKFKPNNIFGFSNRQILSDSVSKLPYDVTFTKLDFQQFDYFYNFYKIQLFEVGNKYCLMIRWGQVGTIGNVKKIFFDCKEEAVFDFRKLFYTKSGHDWESSNGFVPSQGNYRMIDSKRHAQKIRVDIQLNFSYFSQLRSSLSVNLDVLIRRLIEANSKDFKEIEKYEYYNTLHSSLLKRSTEILQNIYNLQRRLVETVEEESKRKILLEMIDLSEEYYGFVNVYGSQLDQLKPILVVEDIYTKYQFVQKLSSIIFSKELLHCAQVCANSPIDYIYHSFKFNLHLLTESSEEYNVIKFFLKSSLTVEANLNMMVFRLGTQQQHSQSSKRYLLWLHLQTRDFFNTMVNGIPVKSYFDSEAIYDSVVLTNKIDYSDISKDVAGYDYLLLCEVPMDNAALTQTQVLKEKNLLNNTDCIIPHNLNNSNYLSHYLCWKGLTFPLKDALGEGPNEFIYLSVNKILPRYLVQFKLL